MTKPTPPTRTTRLQETTRAVTAVAITFATLAPQIALGALSAALTMWITATLHRIKRARGRAPKKPTRTPRPPQRPEASFLSPIDATERGSVGGSTTGGDTGPRTVVGNFEPWTGYASEGFLLGVEQKLREEGLLEGAPLDPEMSPPRFESKISESLARATGNMEAVARAFAPAGVLAAEIARAERTIALLDPDGSLGLMEIVRRAPFGSPQMAKHGPQIVEWLNAGWVTAGDLIEMLSKGLSIERIEVIADARRIMEIYTGPILVLDEIWDPDLVRLKELNFKLRENGSKGWTFEASLPRTEAYLAERFPVVDYKFPCSECGQLLPRGLSVCEECQA